MRRGRGDVIAAIVDHGDVRETLLLEKDGTLIYAERLRPGITRRRPPDGSERARRLDALIDGLRRAAP